MLLCRSLPRYDLLSLVVVCCSGQSGSRAPTVLDLTAPLLYGYGCCYGLLLAVQCALYAYGIVLFVAHHNQSCDEPLATWLLVHGVTGLVLTIPVCCLFIVMMNALSAFVAGQSGASGHQSSGSSSSTVLESLANCGLCLICGLYCVALPLALFSAVWLIVGSVWM